MPSTINADNGVSSGSAGLKSAADSSGVLSLQTNGTTALSISTGQVVTLTNALPAGSGGTGLTSFTANGVVYASSTSALATGSNLVFNGSNLGLGVTPFVNTLSNSFDLAGGAGLFSQSTAVYFSANGYYDSTWKYKATGFATVYSHGNGNHIWFIAPSGTAGNAITFTQAMTLDPSGNLGIGLVPVANNGILQLNSYGSVQALMEKATISATAATGTINYDAATQAVLYYTANASANWTLNIRGSSTLTLNSMMQTGQSLTVAFLVTQGATAYYASALTVDGSAVTPKYQGGSAWTSGNASSIDAYVYTVVKTGSAAFTVFASQTQFK